MDKVFSKTEKPYKYIVKDIVTSNIYLFLLIETDEINTLIDKYIDSAISPSEDTIINNIYNLPELLPENNTIFKYSIEFYTIMDFKNLLFTILNIPKEHFLIYIQNENLDIEKREKLKNKNISFKKFNEILGYDYENDHNDNKELRYINTNVLSGKLDLTYDPSYELIDKQSYIIGNYTILNNTKCLI